jgi:hypothetical protein
MTPSDAPEAPVRKTEIFREQALQAWRGQEAETRVLLDLSPRWMRWALAGIFILAGVGVLLAATTSIPNRATSTASARLSSGGDTVLVDAVFAEGDARIRAGQTMSFRLQEAGARPIDLTILSVTPYPTSAKTPEPPSASSEPSRRVLVRGAVPVDLLGGDALFITGPAASGTVQVTMGEESLLHLLRPRTPGGAKP